MTYPIKTGDPCLISFSQFGYDHWLIDNADSAGIRDDGHPQPWTQRKFDLADGFAQVGWNNLPTAIADYSANDAEFRNADRTQRVTLKEGGKVEIVTGTTSMVLAPDGSITMDSDATVTITTPSVTVDAANTTFTGNVKVDGTTTSTGLLTGSAGLSVVGTGTVTGDLTAAGKSVSTHEHAGDGGTGSGETTGPPI